MRPFLPLLAAETVGASEAEASGGLMIGIAVAFTIVAIGLFFLEILIPSFGLITLVGIACIAGALMAAFSVSRLVGFVFVAIVVVSIPLIVYTAVQLLKGSKLALGPEDTPGTGKDASEGREADLAPGARGVALSTLRPSGTANFDGRRTSVVTMGEMVEAGVQIEVLRVEGTRIIVRSVRV